MPSAGELNDGAEQCVVALVTCCPGLVGDYSATLEIACGVMTAAHPHIAYTER